MLAPKVSQLPPAIVIGLDTMQGLQTARILAAHRIPVIGIARDGDHPACRTRVCAEILVTDTFGEELVRTVAEIGRRWGRSVLVPCHDQAVATASQHREDLEQWGDLVLPDSDVVAVLSNKTSLYEFARRHGFRVPATMTIRNRAEAETAARRLRYPCLLKPSLRSTTWNSRTDTKAYRVGDAEEFLRLYDEVHEWAPEMVGQEWIPGADSALYSLNCYFDQHGRLAASFVARKLRQWPPRLGSSCLGEEARNDEVLKEGLRILTLCAYRGLAYVEMKRHSETGEHYLIEVNVGRPTGRSAIAEAGGVDILYGMYCDAAGLASAAARPQSYRGVKWIDLRHDLQAALHYWRAGELTVREWLRSIRGPKAHAVWSLSDPGPFLWDLWRALRMSLTGRKRVAPAPNAARAVVAPTTHSTVSVRARTGQ